MAGDEDDIDSLLAEAEAVLDLGPPRKASSEAPADLLARQARNNASKASISSITREVNDLLGDDDDDFSPSEAKARQPHKPSSSAPPKSLAQDTAKKGRPVSSC